MVKGVVWGRARDSIKWLVYNKETIFIALFLNHKISLPLSHLQLQVLLIPCSTKLLPSLSELSIVGATTLKTRSYSFEAASQTLSMAAENGDDQQGQVLAAIGDEFDGVIVEIDEPMDTEVFRSLLKASMSHWRQERKKGVWIKLPIEQANLVEPVVKEGFCYHHAEPTYVMLVNWIPQSESTIPPNATHRVRIGAFVMNEQGEVLVVQEKSGNLRGLGVWKFPTGVVEEGEDIGLAAVREVKEETGIDSEFVEILAFGQKHKTFFEKSDLFFVCVLRPLSFDIQPQELEIEAATWMPFEEYAAQSFVRDHKLMRYITNIYKAKIDGVYSGFSPLLTESEFSEAKSYLYLNRRT